MVRGIIEQLSRTRRDLECALIISIGFGIAPAGIEDRTRQKQCAQIRRMLLQNRALLLFGFSRFPLFECDSRFVEREVRAGLLGQKQDACQKRKSQHCLADPSLAAACSKKHTGIRSRGRPVRPQLEEAARQFRLADRALACWLS